VESIRRVQQPSNQGTFGKQLVMHYSQILEADIAAEDRRREQREKLAAANDKITKASQTYQSALRKAHDSATAARKQLNTPPKTVTKPVTATSPLKPLSALPLTA
jgi:hypothetical protein